MQAQKTLCERPAVNTMAKANRRKRKKRKGKRPQASAIVHRGAPPDDHVPDEKKDAATITLLKATNSNAHTQLEAAAAQDGGSPLHQQEDSDVGMLLSNSSYDIVDAADEAGGSGGIRGHNAARWCVIS
jgi:hypothetical protein